MSRNPSSGVTVGTVDNALSTGVCTQPEQAVVQFGYGVRRHAANLVKRALDTLQRKVGSACVIPDLYRVSTEHPQLAVVSNKPHHTIG